MVLKIENKLVDTVDNVPVSLDIWSCVEQVSGCACKPVIILEVVCDEQNIDSLTSSLHLSSDLEVDFEMLLSRMDGPA